MKKIILLSFLIISAKSHGRPLSNPCQAALVGLGLKLSTVEQLEKQQTLKKNLLKAIREIEQFKQNILANPFRFSGVFDQRVDGALDKPSFKKKTLKRLAYSIHVPEWEPIVNWIKAFARYDLSQPNLRFGVASQLRYIIRLCKSVRRRGFIYGDMMNLSVRNMLVQDAMSYEEIHGYIPKIDQMLHPHHTYYTDLTIPQNLQRMVKSQPQVLNMLNENNVNRHFFDFLEMMGFPFQIPMPFPGLLNEAEITQFWMAGLHPLGQVPRWARFDALYGVPSQFWGHDQTHTIISFLTLLGFNATNLLSLPFEKSSHLIQEKLAEFPMQKLRFDLREGGFKLWTYLRQAKPDSERPNPPLISYNINGVYYSLHETYGTTLLSIKRAFDGGM